MAVKNTSAKSTAKNKATEPKEKIEVSKVVEEVAVEAPRARKRLEINRDELVACKASRNNLIYVSTRTSEKFEWMNYGDVHYITLGELIIMKSTQPRMLSEGWVIVDDEEAIEQLGLSKMYGNIFEIEDMDDFFEESSEEMTRILTNMPRGFKNTIASFARERIESGSLDSNRKIKLLEELLDVDLKIFE